EPRLDIGLLAVANCLDEQVPQGSLVEYLAEYVEDLAAKGLAHLFELLEETLENLALPSFLRHEVPHVTDFALSDAMDSPKTLLDAVWVPGQVVVDHEVRSLEIDALPGGIRRDEDQNLFVLYELLLRLSPVFPTHATVDGDNGLSPTEEVS